MDKKIMYAVVIVALLAIAAGAVFAISGSEDEPDDVVPEVMDNAQLKVFGNVNGDRFLNGDDAKLLQRLIDDGKTAAEYPLADANQDGVIDAADLEIVNKVCKGEKTTIWHINFFDENGDGVMDMPVVSTKFPVTAAITHGSTNNLIFLFSLGIVDELKGLTYGSSIDKGLFSDVYMDASKHEKLSGNSEGVDFEDGKLGSSDLIQKEGVTTLIANWNRAQVTAWSEFEKAGVDVVRVAPGAMDESSLVHSAMLVGLLFQKVDRADAYVDLNLKILNKVADSVAGQTKVKAAASSSNGRFSSEGSDYFGVVEAAGGLYGLEGVDFGGSGSIKLKDHPEIFADCDFDKIIGFRAAISYDKTADQAIAEAKKSADYFKDWEHADSGQYYIGGTIPVSLRVAYAACALYPDAISVDDVNQLHKEFINQFYNGKTFDVDSMKFIVTPADLQS